MASRNALAMLLILATAVLSQVQIDHNHQTLSQQTIPANQQCSQIYTVLPISSTSFMTIAADYSQNRLTIMSSSSNSFNDALSKSTSSQVGPQTDALQLSLSGAASQTLYTQVCRLPSDDSSSAQTFSITFGFTCDHYSYPTDQHFICNACPANSTRSLMSSDTSIASCECDEGTYKLSTDAKNPELFTCVVCPYGAVCEGGSKDPFPMDGYYPLNNKDEMIYVKCPFPNACLHSLKNGSSFAVNLDPSYLEKLPIYIPPIPINILLNVSKTNYNLTVNELCSEGYSGYLCGQCKEAYYRLGTRCLSCGNSYSANSFLIVIYVLFLLLVFGLNVPMAIMNTHVSSFGIVLNFLQSMLICVLHLTSDSLCFVQHV
jgi:hypothetical protein